MFSYWDLRDPQPQVFIPAYSTRLNLPLVEWALNPVGRLLVLPSGGATIAEADSPAWNAGVVACRVHSQVDVVVVGISDLP